MCSRGTTISAILVFLAGVAWVGRACYHFELRFANQYKAGKLRDMTAKDIDEERTSERRYAIGSGRLCMACRRDME